MKPHFVTIKAMIIYKNTHIHTHTHTHTCPKSCFTKIVKHLTLFLIALIVFATAGNTVVMLALLCISCCATVCVLNLHLQITKAIFPCTMGMTSAQQLCRYPETS